MQRFLMAMAAAALMVGAAAPAMASGGKGGAGGGGGSSSGGGGNPKVPEDPSATPAPVYGPPCATFSSTSAPVGFSGAVFGAIWNDYTIRSCSTGHEDVDVEVTDRDCASGRVDYDVMFTSVLAAGASDSLVADYDVAPFNATYCITYRAWDSASGTPLDTAEGTATTPPPH